MKLALRDSFSNFGYHFAGSQEAVIASQDQNRRGVVITKCLQRFQDANWLSPEAVSILNHRLAEEQATVGPEMSLRTALLRPDVILLCAIYFFWSLGVYGFVLWLPTIVHQGSELSMGRTGLLSAVPYAAAIVAMLYVAQRSDKTMQRRTMVGGFLLLAGIALSVSFLASAHFAVAFAALIVAAACMYAPYGPFFAIVPERLPRSVLAEVLALINSIGALGGFFGSYFVGWLQGVTGNSRAGYLLMSVSMLCAAVLMYRLGDVKPVQTMLQGMPAIAKGETAI